MEVSRVGSAVEKPLVSVIMPAYNHGRFIAAAVQSVLEQSYSNLEIIVVDDASTDDTSAVLRRFTDPRLSYIGHATNRYAAAARNTGIRASRGQLLAFVDADDRIHPEKLEVQVAVLQSRPDVGLTFNSRLEIDEGDNGLWFVQAAPHVALQDLVMGFPFVPSEVLMRRTWAEKVALFDEGFVFHGEDPDFFMRLALEGCVMAGVDRVLNYRRLYRQRVVKRLANVVNDELRAFQRAFADSRCPPNVLSERNRSLGLFHLSWAYTAFRQEEADLGRSLLREAVRLSPSLLHSYGREVTHHFAWAAARSGTDQEAELRRVAAQLPAECECIRQEMDRAIAEALLYRGAQDLLWGRQVGVQYLQRAATLGAVPDLSFQDAIVLQLLYCASHSGAEVAASRMSALAAYVGTFWSRRDAVSLIGCYGVNMAFTAYRAGQFGAAAANAIRAILSRPRHLTNRGILSVLVRSLARQAFA